MLLKITNYSIFGLPLNMYLGITTLVCFLITAFIAILNRKKPSRLLKIWHHRMATTAITFALIHGTLGILVILLYF